MGWFKSWFAYGLGAGAAREVFGEGEASSAPAPIRNMTEAQIRADEKRFDEDEKRLDAEEAEAVTTRMPDTEAAGKHA